MILLGHRTDAVPLEAGPVPHASARLLRSNLPGPGGERLPLTAAEAGAAFEAVRRTVESEVARLRDLREHAADLSVWRRQAMEAAAADTSKEAQLMHRYEMAHERSLRSAIRQLLALAKSGADLPDEPEPGPEPPEPEPRRPDPGHPAAPPEPEASEKSAANPCPAKTCEKLASVGAAASPACRPEASAGSEGRPGRPIGADPGPGFAPKRR